MAKTEHEVVAKGSETQVRDGPFVAAAFLCDRVLQEKDGTLTFVRVIDEVRANVPKPAPDRVNVVLPREMVLVAAIKLGQADHTYDVSILITSPSGQQRRLEPPGQVAAGGVHSGFNFLANMSFVPEEAGIYNFDVFVDGALLSRVPLHVVITQSE